MRYLKVYCGKNPNGESLKIGQKIDVTSQGARSFLASNREHYGSALESFKLYGRVIPMNGGADLSPLFF